MSWIDDLLGVHVRRDVTIYPKRRYLEVLGGVIVEDNPANDSVRLTFGDPATSGVPAGRIINATSPVRINGGASANLSADVTISVLDATAGAQGVVRLTGDLAGTATAPVTARLNGATVPAAGALVPGNVLQVSAVAALIYAAVNLAGGANYVTGRLPIANLAFDNPDTVLTTNAAGNNTQYRKIVNANVDDNAAIAVAKLAAGSEGQFLRIVSSVPTWATVTVGSGGVSPGTDGQIFVTSAGPTSGWATAAGDWDGAVTANVVRRLRGAAIGSAAGALTTGAVLRVTGASTIDYGAVNLANSAAVTGALPIANIAPHSAIAILTTNGALATEWATTIPSGVIPALAGDVTGAIGANTVMRVRGAAVGTAAGALVTGQSLRVTGVAAADWGPIDLANGNAITGALPLTNIAQTAATTGQAIVWNGTQWAPGSPTGVGTGSIAPGTVGQILVTGAGPATTWATAAGDWSGAVTANVVGRINGATVPASGALVTGNVLQVTGVAALSYGPINLAGGANFVTGALPLTNLAQTGAIDTDVMAWGVSGTPSWRPRSLSSILPPSALQNQNVATLADMQLIVVTGLLDGTSCWVRSLDREFRLKTTGITPDPANDTYNTPTAGRIWMGAA